MYHRNFNGLLLRPSLLSSVICGFLAVAMPITVNWSSVLMRLPFYGYFFGPAGLVDVLWNNRQGSTGGPVNSKTLEHAVSIVIGAMLAGLALYIALRLVVKLVSSISMTIKEMRAVETPAKYVVEREVEKRVGIRVLVVAMWAVYCYLFIKVIVPLCIFTSQTGLSQHTRLGEGIGYVLFSSSFFFFALHVHIVLARLLLLRPRIFGGEEAILHSE
jgi:hypothetical protein